MNTITFDDNIVVMKLKDFKNASDSRNRFYKCWRAKVEECENLQSKIDKAIEFVEKHSEKQYAYNYEYYLDDEEISFLLDILKEDK